jgi:hypothetical protein
LKFLVSLQGPKEGLLHRIFGSGIVTQSKDRVFEKVVTVFVQPSAGVGI